MSRDPLVISGGNAIIFGASLILDLRKKSIQDGDPITRDEGMKIGATVKKNHCTPQKNPYLKTDYYVIFGKGTEQYLEMLENATNQGILTKAGSWIKDFGDNGEPREWQGVKLAWQGKETFRKFCRDNPEYFKELQDRVAGIGVEQMSEEEIAAAIADEEAIKADVKEIATEIATPPAKSRKKK